MKMVPVRIQRSRQQKQLSPNGLPIVYVGRPTQFGNPFIITAQRDAATCVKLYRRYLAAHPGLKRLVKIELKGKNLSCWCKPGSPCHADVLLRVANN